MPLRLIRTRKLRRSICFLLHCYATALFLFIKPSMLSSAQALSTRTPSSTGRSTSQVTECHKMLKVRESSEVRIRLFKASRLTHPGLSSDMHAASLETSNDETYFVSASISESCRLSNICFALLLPTPALALAGGTLMTLYVLSSCSVSAHHGSSAQSGTTCPVCMCTWYVPYLHTWTACLETRIVTVCRCTIRMNRRCLVGLLHGLFY